MFSKIPLIVVIEFIELFLVFFSFMDVLSLGVKLELQLSAYDTATATWDLSHICDLHHSSEQHCILNPLSKASD